jgi:hypothetical protein
MGYRLLQFNSFHILCKIWILNFLFDHQFIFSLQLIIKFIWPCFITFYMQILLKMINNLYTDIINKTEL